MRQNLRYRISDWEQATECLSNNSRDLYIQTGRFLLNKDLEGFVIKVIHNTYGVLFAAMTEGKGYLLTPYDVEGYPIPFLTTQQIIEQLSRFGFNILYVTEVSLSGKQLSFLMDLQHLGFNKLNVMRVTEPRGRAFKRKVVALNSALHSNLLKFEASVSSAQFAEYISESSVYNITDSAVNSTEFKWDWLEYICNISDILKANSTEGCIDLTCPPPPSAPMPFNYELMSEPVGE